MLGVVSIVKKTLPTKLKGHSHGLRMLEFVWSRAVSRGQKISSRHNGLSHSNNSLVRLIPFSSSLCGT